MSDRSRQMSERGLGPISVARLLGASLLLCGSVLSIPVEAREQVDAASVRRQALDGINVLQVRVDIVERGGVAEGITGDQLDRAIRAKVREAAFFLDDYGPNATNLAEIHVTVNRLDLDGPRRVYAVQVGLFQVIDLTNPPRRLFARIWGSDLVRAASTAKGIREIVDDDVDLLLTDLAAANPGKRHPVPDPRPVAPATRCEPPEPGHAGSALKILVKDQQGLALPDATARFSRAGEPAVAYPPTAWVKPGKWHVEVSAPDFKPASYDFQVYADKVCSTTVYLEESNFRSVVFDAECPACGKQAALLVKVTDQNGAALPGVSVSIDGSERTTNDEGVVTLDELAPGKHGIQVTLAGFDGGEIAFEARPGRQTVAHATMTLTPVY